MELLKGTVSLTSKDPPCKHFFVFLCLKLFYFDNSYLFSFGRNAQVSFVENPQLIIVSFLILKIDIYTLF